MKNDQIERILIAVRNLLVDSAGVDFGGLAARKLSASVTLLRVVARDKERKTAEMDLEQAQQALTGLDLRTRIRKDKDVNRAILTELDSGAYNMLVVGRVGGRRLAKLLLETRGHCLAGRTDCPVLIVNKEHNRLERILICTSGQKASERVVAFGARLTYESQAKASLLHVVSQVPSMYTGLDEIDETLAELLQTETPLGQHLRWCARTLDQHNVPAELNLRHGVVVDEILNEIRECGYDLVAIGSAPLKKSWRAWMLGDVTRQVIDSAPCPVLVV
jgi:nucleotide-binding universal stress UspA family protein